MMHENLISNLVRGSLAGTAATVPMSAAMLALARCTPPIDPRSLPPHQITYEAVESVQARSLVDEQIGDVLTSVAHFEYRATMGSSVRRALRAPTGAAVDTRYGLWHRRMGRKLLRVAPIGRLARLSGAQEPEA